MIRIVSLDDARDLLEIYSYYVKHTAVTFEYEVPDIEEFKMRISHTIKKYPYVVAIEEGQIAGYAHAGPFHERKAYDWAVETSIYVKHDIRHKGIGKQLYLALETYLYDMGVINLNACIAYPVKEDVHLDTNSIEYHKHLGYRWVGRFHKCGYKFGTWYDMVWMEKCLRRHPDCPQPVIWFEQIRGDFHE